MCPIFVLGQPAEILRQVLSPSLVDENEASPELTIRVLGHKQEAQCDHEGARARARREVELGHRGTRK